MHVVAVIALDGVVPFDLAVPCEVFGRARHPDGSAAYQVRVCGPSDEVDAGAFALRPRWDLGGLASADTVIVPGVHDPSRPTAPAVIDALRAAAEAGVRIASICSGAFVLAAAGLLDGQRATTHWLGTDELASRHPAVRVDPDVLYVDNGQILTSAGAAAGLDLCLHMVRRDHGAAVAADAARLSVMALERDGGQAQFIARHPPAPAGSSLAPVLSWLEENLHQQIELQQIAARAGMSVRTLSRQFRAQTGTTPLQWLHRCRVVRAQHVLETTDEPVDKLATDVGFGSVTAFRDRFTRMVGTTPSAYRRSFRTPVRG
jgi:transcriptional regulator GlxA family with amidase domain